MCLAVFVPPAPDPVPSRREPGRQALPAQKVTVPKEPNEEGMSAEEEVKSAEPDAEEADEEALLLDDQEEDVGVTEIIGAEFGKDDT